VAVQKLVARGQAPTPVAVAGQVRTTEAAALAAAARKARLRPQVDQAGPAAALTVEDLWQQRGKAPSPRMVGLTLGWAKADTWPLTVLLVEAGWLCNEHRRLTPGSRARGPDTGPAP
jgi:hypothetical protein